MRVGRALCVVMCALIVRPPPLHVARAVTCPALPSTPDHARIPTRVLTMRVVAQASVAGAASVLTSVPPRSAVKVSLYAMWWNAVLCICCGTGLRPWHQAHIPFSAFLQGGKDWQGLWDQGTASNARLAPELLSEVLSMHHAIVRTAMPTIVLR